MVWTVDDVLPGPACDQLIARVAEGPWLAATVNRAEGRAVDPTIRNNRLALVDDAKLAAQLLERLRADLPERCHVAMAAAKATRTRSSPA